MRHDLTLSEVARVLKSRGQKMTLSHSGGQYHVYVFEGETMKGYDRADDLDVAVERVVHEDAH